MLPVVFQMKQNKFWGCRGTGIRKRVWELGCFLLFCCRKGDSRRKWSRYRAHPRTDTCTHMPRQTRALSTHRYTQADTQVCALTQRNTYKCQCILCKSQALMEKTRKSSSASAPGVRSFPAVHLHFVRSGYNSARQCGYFLVSGSIILPPSRCQHHNLFHGLWPEFHFFSFVAALFISPLNHSRSSLSAGGVPPLQTVPNFQHSI